MIIVWERGFYWCVSFSNIVDGKGDWKIQMQSSQMITSKQPIITTHSFISSFYHLVYKICMMEMKLCNNKACMGLTNRALCAMQCSLFLHDDHFVWWSNRQRSSIDNSGADRCRMVLLLDRLLFGLPVPFGYHQYTIHELVATLGELGRWGCSFVL